MRFAAMACRPFDRAFALLEGLSSGSQGSQSGVRNEKE